VQTDLHITEPQKIPYIIPHVTETSYEINRLDEMHEGWKDFFDGRLSFAPLDDSEPKSILEIGSGSGAWAIQAANTFPNAEVLAVDLVPIPPRPLPSNLKFQRLNLIDPFPFEPGTFDIVHARLVFMHLPKAEQIITRVIQLVKPGGWLLIEDLDLNVHGRDGLDISPALIAWFDGFIRALKDRGVDHTAPIFDKIAEASGVFSEVNVRKVGVPFSANTDDIKLNNFGVTLRNTVYRLSVLLEGNETPGFTRQLSNEVYKEIHDPNCSLIEDMVSMWSRKHV